MANSVIQVKRSTTNAAPTGLANGELAYTANGEVLFLGSPNGNGISIAIGGRRFPGVLTANHALVANATSAIDKIIVANLVPTFIYANTAFGTDGQILTSNSIGGVYWGAAPSGITNLTDTADATTVTIESSSGTDAVLVSANSTNAGILTASDWTKLNTLTANGIGSTTNTQVFYNNSNTVAGDANFTFDTTTDILTVVGGVKTGNSTANVTGNSTIIQITNSTSTANLTPLALTIGSAVVNSTVLTIGTGNFSTGANVGANVLLSTSAVFVGNSTVNATHNSGLVQVSNSTSTANLTALALTIGSAVVNSTVLTIGTGNFSTGANVGANVLLSTSALRIGNSTVNSSYTATQIQVANSTVNVTVGPGQVSVGANVFANSTAVDVGNTVITSTNLTLGGQVTANAGVGTAGQVLTSSGAANVYWTTPTTGTVTSVTGGNGLTGSVSTTGALDVGAGNGITVATDSVAVNANTTGGLVANSTGLSVKLGTGISFDGSGNLAIGQAVATTSNVTFNDITASGNLVVNGTLVTLDVETLQVEDPLIALARLNTAADTVDIGLYGTYNDGSTRYSGIFRDASNSDIWTIFANTTVVPTTTVDTGGTGYTLGGLLAGSLTLGTALAVGSGGTGRNSLTNNYVLVGNTAGPVQMIGSSTEGHVLQVTATGTVAFGVLDGGTF